MHIIYIYIHILLLGFVFYEEDSSCFSLSFINKNLSLFIYIFPCA